MCEFFCVPVAVYYFVIVLFRIVSHEPALIPPPIVESLLDNGAIGMDGPGLGTLGRPSSGGTGRACVGFVRSMSVCGRDGRSGLEDWS